jgi:hypothetical protein
MKTAFLVLISLVISVVPASSVLADTQISCETVRAYVIHVGLQQARAQVHAAGMTAAQERKARRCLAKGD